MIFDKLITAIMLTAAVISLVGMGGQAKTSTIAVLEPYQTALQFVPMLDDR
ncbi:MAG: hypothetical protein NW224_24175 [Leptolyngbyaceae cyanobacterium bins.302]|nr:hypothetical protein [Leptolyngbyaceae cyanobacterium bins.302]